jgi:8-oxo-dGTP pyrophosphatase MutT (NUDIX family)
MADDLFAVVRSGAVKIRIDQRYPLAEVAEAHRELEARKTTGCTVLRRCHWVQRRALDKPNDPGMWDTLMGGMVPAADTLQAALARETHEEAGLALVQLQHLRHGGRVAIRRPSGGGGAAGGYTVEHVDWFQCTVPDGVEPVNQDGEVDEFRLMTGQEVLQRLHDNEFTLEAALVLCAMGW